MRRGRLNSRAGEPKPFDKAFSRLSEHPEVLQHLAPMQALSTRSESFQQSGKGKAKGDQSSSSKGKGKHSSKGGVFASDPSRIMQTW